MDEREHAAASTDDRQATPPDVLRGRGAVLAVVGARGRRRTRSGARGHRGRRCRAPFPPSRGVRSRRSRRLPGHPRAAGRLLSSGPAPVEAIGERDALADEAPCAGGSRAARSGCACPRCARGSWPRRCPPCGSRAGPAATVSSWTITSGRRLRHAARSASASNTSTTATSAPAARTSSARAPASASSRSPRARRRSIWARASARSRRSRRPRTPSRGHLALMAQHPARAGAR